MRLKVPNGIINADQMRFFADCVSQYPEDEGEHWTRSEGRLE